MRILRSLTVAGLLAPLLATLFVVPGSAHAGTPEAPEAAEVTLPAPTGPYRVGGTELHLVDRDRPDPWVPDRRRELMVSVFYPAGLAPAGSSPTQRYPRAPWMLPGAAEHFDQAVSPTLGIEPGEVDWAGARTHARTGAPARGGLGGGLDGLGGRPVVLYSPGFGVPRTAGTLLVEELASRGYVVVTVDHTYEASEVEFPGGRVEVARVPDPTPDVLKPG